MSDISDKTNKFLSICKFKTLLYFSILIFNPHKMYSVTSNNEEKVVISLAPVTAAGNPAPLDGMPTWAVMSGDATLEVSADGMSCTFISGVANVINEVSVTADADLGEGVRTISETIVYTVTPAEAATLGIASEVSPK